MEISIIIDHITTKEDNFKKKKELVENVIRKNNEQEVKMSYMEFRPLSYSQKLKFHLFAHFLFSTFSPVLVLLSLYFSEKFFN